MYLCRIDKGRQDSAQFSIFVFDQQKNCICKFFGAGYIVLASGHSFAYVAILYFWDMSGYEPNAAVASRRATGLATHLPS